MNIDDKVKYREHSCIIIKKRFGHPKNHPGLRYDIQTDTGITFVNMPESKLTAVDDRPFVAVAYNGSAQIIQMRE